MGKINHIRDAGVVAVLIHLNAVVRDGGDRLSGDDTFHHGLHIRLVVARDGREVLDALLLPGATGAHGNGVLGAVPVQQESGPIAFKKGFADEGRQVRSARIGSGKSHGLLQRNVS